MKIYDNSNVAESYCGATTPLTFSFAASVYGQAYVHFCGMMGVAGGTIAANSSMFGSMISFIGGRIYYDLLNWYRLVSLLPGYAFNRAFFEKMMGLQKEYSYEPAGRGGAAAAARLAVQTCRVALAFLFMGPLIRRFNARFDRTLAALNALDPGKMTPADCASVYRRVLAELSRLWRAPLANDFAVMVSAGAADRLCRAWLGEDGYPRLFERSQRPLVTLDPGYRLLEIVSLLAADPELLRLFSTDNAPGAVLAALRGPLAGIPAARAIEDYLLRFGSRAPNELKLEAVTMNERPEFMISILQGALAGRRSGEGGPAALLRADAAAALPLPKRLLLAAAQRWAVAGIRRREETRWRRALIFGFTRRLFLALGAKLAAAGRLEAAEDVFYLFVDEALKLAETPDLAPDPRPAVAARRAEYEFWRGRELPRRIETELEPAALQEELRAAAAPAPERGILRGRIAARTPDDRISGEALVLPDFDPAADFSGKILVTRQTDPGWTIIFPLLKGIVVERGGMLSHAAIVARELRIPCIVGVERAVTSVPQGAGVELRLETGEVHVLA